ncbi:hypothetical protein J0X14_05935 [Muricauda sp. CAU 1633]|uniref:DUF5675 family protein n=1 Tax=Allomuricauda sp. CAU 1633 TaxID=2816036 RepID=UPI001A8FF1F3|nr:DUF5675 family protein [Muricauda sp. CAU 1633]MBO0321829.1 hypothetical protein [Muricauda sp. CAU 1633]
MLQVLIVRDMFFGKEASLGVCLVFHRDNKLFKGESLERGWVNNKQNISCIPEGEYPLVLEYSPRFKKELWEIKEVPGRSECKFHSANYWYQLNGCIALGNNRKFLDGDEIMDITSSRNTMKLFHKALKGEQEARLTIRNAPSILSY